MRLLLAIAFALVSAAAALAEDFPVPKEPNQVFYVQRSLNPNTIIYAARIKDGALDPKKPVDVYWRRYNDDGERKELSSVESRFAFGVRSEPVKDQPGAFRVSVVSYPKRSVILRIVDGVPRLEGQVAGKPARLDHAYLEVEDGGSVPTVKRVDLYGFALADGKPLKESFIPQ